MVVARVKRAQLFREDLLLVTFLLHAVRYERVMPNLVPRCRLRLILLGRLSCGPWSSPLTRAPALDCPPSGSSGASMPYLPQECITFWGLALSALSDCRVWGPARSLSAAVPCCGRGSAVVLVPGTISILLPPAPLSLVAWVVGGGSILSPFLFVLPGTPST